MKIGILIIYLMAVILSCQTRQNNETVNKLEKPLRDINIVMKEHTQELMALPGVVGIYIGKTRDDQFCIRIMVEKKTKQLQKKIPKIIEGHPVEIDETGVIRPL